MWRFGQGHGSDGKVHIYKSAKINSILTTNLSRFIQLGDAKPEIDLDSAAGLTLNENIGNIYLKDVEFTYRSR